jgi:DNA-binding transcriptional MerR regulator
MRIGCLAQRAEVNPKTVRYYEQIGLLPEPRRTSSGYRDYDEQDLDRLVFIRRSQQLGLQLDEIREILALREQAARPCGFVVEVAQRRLAELDERIATMQLARRELRRLLERAERSDAAPGRYCRLIEHQQPPPTP